MDAKQFSTYQEYLEYEQNLDDSARAKHFRDDYHESCDLWPDYLDYLEDWEYSYEQRLTATIKDFVYTVLAVRRMKFLCGTHTHQFTTDPGTHSDDPNLHIVVVRNKEDYLNTTSCWYHNITVGDERLVKADPKASSSRLSVPESLLIKRATQLNLMIKDHTTHQAIDFETFKREWWSQESKDNAMRIFTSSETPLVQIKEQVLKDVKEQIDTDLVSKKTGQWFYEGPEQNIYEAENVEYDHGFHALLRSVEQPKSLIDTINEIRRRDPNHTLLDYGRIHTKITECHECQTHQHHNPYPSPPCVLYAPPGNGKSTVLRKELIVGIDTDWLNRHSKYTIIMKPFIDKGIPVITNQYDIVPLSGERVFGFFNPNQLRQDFAGKPLTTLAEIVAAQRTYGDDFFIIYDYHHMMSDCIHDLLRAVYMARLTEGVFQRGRCKPPQLPETFSWEPTTTHEILEKLSTWAEYKPKKKRAKRSKFKRRHKDL